MPQKVWQLKFVSSKRLQFGVLYLPTFQSLRSLLCINWWHPSFGYRFWLSGSETGSHFASKDKMAGSLKCQGDRERAKKKRACQHETETCLAEESLWVVFSCLIVEGSGFWNQKESQEKSPGAWAALVCIPYSPNATNPVKLLSARLQ